MADACLLLDRSLVIVHGQGATKVACGFALGLPPPLRTPLVVAAGPCCAAKRLWRVGECKFPSAAISRWCHAPRDSLAELARANFEYASLHECALDTRFPAQRRVGVPSRANSHDAGALECQNETLLRRCCAVVHVRAAGVVNG